MGRSFAKGRFRGKLEVYQEAVQAAEEDMDLDPAGEEAEEVSAAVQMTEDEQKAQGFYNVEAILRHDYKQGWRFLTKWEGFSASETTWEPTRAFSLGGGEINEVFQRYCVANELPHPLAEVAVALFLPGIHQYLAKCHSGCPKMLRPSQRKSGPYDAFFS